MAIGLCYLFFAACSKNQADTGTPVEPPTPSTKVTYTNTVGALLDTKCGFCHAPGKAQASFWTFNGYSSVIDRADQIHELVLVTKVMPKSGSLSATELKSLQDWYDQGKLQ
ncbi:MAG: hypothetical protein JWQ28_2272 [Pedobacter sp.]|nr:hypothetical protein [Pedobacter sp.]